MDINTGFQGGEMLPFYDDFHFPRGFARSGYFSIKQAEIIGQYGRRLSALWKGEAIAETEDELSFVAFCRGEKEASNDFESAWRAYLAAIKQLNTSLVR